MQAKQILLQKLHYSLPDGRPIFKDLSINFHQRKIGLVGHNGVGKSTLLKLITGELMPQDGSIQFDGILAYMPQNPNFSLNITISEFLGFSERLLALSNIEAGSCEEQDYEVLNEDWDIRARLQQQLREFGLEKIPENRCLANLSGGEATRILLCKMFFSGADFLLLDEPTNHLDQQSRERFYQTIHQWPGGLVIVSHDRKLLNHMDEIIELSSHGCHVYGGNYEAYFEQKKVEVAAAQQLLKARKELQNKAKHVTQVRRERHEQNEAKGRKAKKAQIDAKGSYDKLEFKSAQGRSEKTNRRIRLQTDRKLDYMESQYSLAKEKIEIDNKIDVAMPATKVPNSKIILEIENLVFHYSEQSQLLLKNLSLQLRGPKRIAVTGENGSGKSTLIKLILGELLPLEGSIHVGTPYVCYLDQRLDQLDHEKSVLDNFLFHNPGATFQEAHQILAQFLFRNTVALKIVKNLSGGEKLRAMLACVLMSKNPPQLLILDEPTNHLDLSSIENIESALKNYEGAMIVISHDEHFLKNISVREGIDITRGTPIELPIAPI